MVVGIMPAKRHGQWKLSSGAAAVDGADGENVGEGRRNRCLKGLIHTGRKELSKSRRSSAAAHGRPSGGRRPPSPQALLPRIAAWQAHSSHSFEGVTSKDFHGCIDNRLSHRMVAHHHLPIPTHAAWCWAVGWSHNITYICTYSEAAGPTPTYARESPAGVSGRGGGMGEGQGNRARALSDPASGNSIT